MAVTDSIRFVAMMGFLIALFMGIGYLFAGIFGMTVAFIVALIFNLVSFLFCDKFVLAIYGARPYSNPEIEAMLRRLAKSAGIKTPKLYIVNDPQPNAFATGKGRNSGVVVVTRGLVELLDKEEIEGVLAHEVAHIKNRDILISTAAATVAGAISYIAELLWWSTLLGDEERPIWAVIPMLILAPLAATLIQLAISRTREFIADETGAKLCRHPEWLARALRKIEGFVRAMPMERGSTSTAHLWIANPFKLEGITKLFSTHPPTEERIRRHEELARRMR